MQYLKFQSIKHKISGIIQLPPSKSESNRALIIRAISGADFLINNLSDAEDTSILAELLNKINNRKNYNRIEQLDAGAAGTVMRFLAAFLCIKKGTWLLTGNDRMLHRPIKALVDALNQIGMGIKYVKRDGFPPIIIEGLRINSSNLEINPGISSQFTSSLLMIAPYLKEGLKINFIDKIVSRPYVEMTLKMMHYFGIEYKYDISFISVDHQIYKSKDISINYDWSAASYMYEIIALSEPGSEIFLKGLKKEGLQGDEIVSDIFNSFGVSTIVEKDGIRIKKDKQNIGEFTFNFSHCPDLALTVIVCCAAMKIKGRFYGLKSLAIKESNRLKALQKELQKIGCIINIVEEEIIEISDLNSPVSLPVIINTYNDHRMAMAFAPMVLKTDNIVIENPDVVKKSYPKFWENLSKIGFNYTTSSHSTI